MLVRQNCYAASFTETEKWHGVRRLRVVAPIQGLLIATGQNLKRFLAATGWGRRHAPCGNLLTLPVKPRGLSAAYG